ncbi:MAG: transposase-like protein [Pirellulaceae bacterium]|jgi:transposase-like protein
MSKRKSKTGSQKSKRRSFSQKFKEEAVRLVLEQKVPEAARNLGIGDNLLRRWKAYGRFYLGYLTAAAVTSQRLLKD